VDPESFVEELSFVEEWLWVQVHRRETPRYIYHLSLCKTHFRADMQRYIRVIESHKHFLLLVLLLPQPAKWKQDRQFTKLWILINFLSFTMILEYCNRPNWMGVFNSLCFDRFGRIFNFNDVNIEINFGLSYWYIQSIYLAAQSTFTSHFRLRHSTIFWL
jgi:hypothetical protein